MKIKISIQAGESVLACDLLVFKNTHRDALSEARMGTSIACIKN